MTEKTRNIPKTLFIFFLITFVAWLIVSYAAARFATRTVFEDIPPASDYFEEEVKETFLSTSDHITITAWYLKEENSSKSVILLNGIYGNRIGLVERAKLYRTQGYSVLMPDLRGTGESTGNMVTFGWFERLDLQACYDFLKENGHQQIAVHGLSLGAATIVYSLPNENDYEFIILESCYDNVTQALHNRIEKYYIPPFLCSAMTKFTERRLGVESERLSPQSYIKFAQAPTLIIAGDSEQKVKMSETENIFDRCGAEEKELHFIKGAIHENFLNRFEDQYLIIWKDWMRRFG